MMMMMMMNDNGSKWAWQDSGVLRTGE